MERLPDGIPISELTFDQLQELKQDKAGWIYPRRSISKFIPLFPRLQRAALNVWGWIAIGMALCGLAFPFLLGSWWWLLLLVGGIMVWRANRTSMEQFFTENLETDEQFFDTVRSTELARWVKIVLTDNSR